MKKLKTFYGIEGNNDKVYLIMVPSGSHVRDFLALVNQRTNNNFTNVYLEGAEVDLEELFDDIYSKDAILYVSNSNMPPEIDIMSSLMKSRSGGIVFNKPKNDDNRTNQPTNQNRSNTNYQQNANPRPQYPNIDGNANKVQDITKTNVRINQNVIGINTKARVETQTNDNKFLVFTTATPESLFKGNELDINFNMSVQQVTDVIIHHVKTLHNYKTPIKLILYLSSGLPFNNGTLGDFFGLPECTNLKKKIYAIVTRDISIDLLAKQIYEICDISNNEQKLLLSPIVDSTEIGLTHIACLLGYLNHDGANTDIFIKSIAKISGFAPLIIELNRIQNRNEVTGTTVATVSASLYTIFTSILPEMTEAKSVFEYSLRCSCFIRHIDDADGNLPIKPLDWKNASDSGLKKYLARTNQKKIVYSYSPDLDGNFVVLDLARPDPLAIENAHNTMASFKPFPPLSIRGISGTNIIKGHNGRTLLYLHESMSKDAENANSIDFIDPLTGMTETRNVEELAKEIGDSSIDRSANLIEPSRVKQIVQVCFDESESMGWKLNRGKCVLDTDISRMTIAKQYLTTFANRTYGYRIPCIQGLISFNNIIRVQSPLSPLVPDFEKGISEINPICETHLWDALDKAADDLSEFNKDPSKHDGKKYQRAKLRIVVISDGEDQGSKSNPVDVCAKLLQLQVIVDAIIISKVETCKALCALCHITGGLAFRPEEVADGLEIFEQEAFLSIECRKKQPKLRSTLTEELFTKLTNEAVFDITTVNQVIQAAAASTKLTTPLTMIGRNRNQEIPNPRHRRILRELHYAAEVQSKEREETYDPDIRILTFSSNFDRWRVYIKGPPGTPYADKWWYLYVSFTDEYPVQPPIFRFISIPYHLNVSAEGRICLNMIEKGYMSTDRVVDLIQRIKELFARALEDTPIQIEKLMIYKLNRAEYDRRAYESTRNNAKNTYEEWIEGITVINEVPSDFDLSPSKVIPPYMRSVISGKEIDPKKVYVSSTGTIYDIDEFKQMLATNKNPIDLCTGKQFTETLNDFN